MAVTNLGGVWDIEDVLGTSRGSTGVPMLQIGDVKTGTVVSNSTALFSSGGIVHFPAPPKAGVSAPQALVFKSSAGDIAFAVRDTGTTKLTGQMKMGETAVLATVGMARALFKVDGSITVYTTDDNTETGQSIFLSVGTDGIKAGGPWGAFTMTSAGIQIASAGGAWLLLGSDGNVTLGGAQISIAGGSVVLGMSGTPVTPALYGLTGVSGVASSSVFVSV